MQVAKKIINEEGTIELRYRNNAKEYFLVNGLKKRIYEDGVIVLTMVNNDVKIVIIILV